MSRTLLIDSIVRQTTVLIAQLATAAGNRPSLAHVANQVLMNLVSELKAQGLGNKVIADMFGMALRTYHDRVARLSESQSESGRSLWDAVLAYIQEKGPVLRADVLRRFHRDGEAMVRGVLRDLVSSGLLFRSGQGDHTMFRAAAPEEQGLSASASAEASANMLLVAIHRHGPCTGAEVQKLVPLGDAELTAQLERLVADGRLSREPGTAGANAQYRTERIFIPYGAPEGWEAAVLDHYQTVVAAVSAKLRQGRTHARSDDAVGGSTYHLDIWEGHPLERDALGFLANVRRQAVALRSEVEAYNAQHKRPADAAEMRVVSYVGQTVFHEGADDHEA
jgi:hypothetical protein